MEHAPPGLTPVRVPIAGVQRKKSMFRAGIIALGVGNVERLADRGEDVVAGKLAPPAGICRADPWLLWDMGFGLW